jgi:hypothetical protein
VGLASLSGKSKRLNISLPERASAGSTPLLKKMANHAPAIWLGWRWSPREMKVPGTLIWKLSCVLISG